MDALNTAKEKAVQRRLDNFAKQYGSDRLNLARHAALPVAFTPDLLYCIWSNFQHDPQPWPEWVGVADVLLSRLCKEVSHELYELDTEVRDVLLQQLAEYFGQERVQEVARFLVAYAEYERQRTANPDVEDLAEAQRWVALAYLDPDRVVAEVSHALQQNNEANHWRILNLQSVFPPDLRPRLEKLIQESRPRRVEPEPVEVESNKLPPLGELIQESKPSQVESAPKPAPAKAKTKIENKSNKIEWRDPLPRSLFSVGGGTLAPNDPTYIEREVDKICWQMLHQKPTSSIIIQGARETGKSSFIQRMIYRLQQETYKQKVIQVDFQEIFSQQVLESDETEFFKQLCYQMLDELDLSIDVVDTFWEKQRIPNTRKFERFIRQHINSQMTVPYILALDETDRMLTSPFGQDFFNMLRSWHKKQGTDNLLSKMTLFVGFSTEPYLFLPQIAGILNPLDFGKRFILPDFTRNEVQMLLKNDPTILHSEEVDFVIDFLNGHPFLTRVAISALLRKTDSIKTLRDNITFNVFSPHLQRFNYYLKEQPNLADYLKQVCQGSMVTTTNNPLLYRLEGAGILKLENSKVVFRNKLYQEYFSEILGLNSQLSG